MKNKLQGNKKTILTLLSLLLFIAVILIAWNNRFIQDDAFISFRYAKNMVEGHGLVWNTNGERVEGYTNFLWTIIMAIPISLNIEPILFSYIFGIILFSLTLFYSYKFTLLLCKSKYLGLLSVLLLGLNYSFSCYATGGLETQMQALFYILIMYLLSVVVIKNKYSNVLMFLMSLICSLAMLTRLDSAIIVVPSLMYITYKLYKDNKSNRMKEIFILMVPFLIVIGAWLLWKYDYYGDILPNTYYAKATSYTSYLRGLKYVWIFLTSYLFVPVVILLGYYLKNIIENKESVISLLLTLVFLWFAYIVKVGGDFMEFRILIPIISPMIVLFVWIIFDKFHNKYVSVILISIVIFGSFKQYTEFGKFSYQHEVESINQLKGHLFKENWIGIGKTLGSIFGGSKNIILATTAAGAVPYYSNLETIDILGLNDKWIAKHGQYSGTTRPGHSKIATLDYLVKKKVNLIPCLDLIKDTSKIKYEYDILHWFIYSIKKSDKLPVEMKIIVIPVENDYKMLVLYLNINSEVDYLINKNKLVTHVVKQ